MNTEMHMNPKSQSNFEIRTNLDDAQFLISKLTQSHTKQNYVVQTKG